MSLTRRVVSWLIVALLLGAGLAALLNRQWIADYIAYSSYSPASEISSMVSRSGMSDIARFHFYSSHPEIADSDKFNTSCQRREKTSPILGCYILPENKIYIYDVTDVELDGIKDVTAAHEMLHVVYARLNQSQKDWLAPRLEQAYERLETDNLKVRMDYYQSAEPGSRINELHSILPTEFSDLGDELEEYYNKYFDNRQAVVALYQKYSNQFYALEKESIMLEDRLRVELADINARDNQYRVDMARLNSDIVDFNNRASSGYFSTQAEFDAERALLEVRASELAARYDELSRAIDEYNAGVERLNSLGLRMDKLNKSIDSFEEIE